MKKPWENNWKIIEEIPGGSQSSVYLVHNKQSHEKAILKKLRNQQDSERRRRMHREVTTLETLNHDGIPQLLDSNSYEYKSDSILYLVLEFVEGITLEEKINNGILKVEETIILIKKMLGILKYIHSRGLVHRDIKPNNIILKNASFTDPVLIDFGLTFNENDEELKSLTYDQQQLGNRFLALPELQIRSSLQRDPRSDLTQCMGIFLYCITGQIPITLLDESQSLPHQRKPIRNQLNNIEHNVLNYLFRIFDRSFDIRIDYRWQSIDELLENIDNIMNKQNDESTKLPLLQIKDKINNNSDQEFRKLIYDIWTHVYQIARQITHYIIDNLDNNFSQMGKGLGVDWRKLTFAEEQGIQHLLYDDFKFIILFVGKVTGNEIILQSKIDDKVYDICRFPLIKNNDWDKIESQIRSHYIKKFENYSNLFFDKKHL